MTDYDSELRRHDEVLRRAGAVRTGERVLDIGCGTGHTTRWAANALGIDIRAAAVEQARALSPGTDFAVGDAQVHPFEPASFDVAISRFGTMFFADPVAAFTNIGRALRPGGRLVMPVWQARDRNEWAVLVQRALGTGGPDAFSLADPPSVERILTAAGFTDVTFTDVPEPVDYGPDVPAALAWVRGFAGPRATDAALETLRAPFTDHLTPEGVLLASHSWLVTARPRPH